jgi:uncharacterized protein YjiS (DUF1127 family)
VARACPLCANSGRLFCRCFTIGRYRVGKSGVRAHPTSPLSCTWLEHGLSENGANLSGSCSAVPMTSKIAARENITAASFAPIGHAFAASAMGIWRLVVAIKHRRELAHLADFDDRMLADIGLTRTDLRDAHSEPLWRDPTSMLSRRARLGHRRSRTDRSEPKGR